MGTSEINHYAAKLDEDRPVSSRGHRDSKAYTSKKSPRLPSGKIHQTMSLVLRLVHETSLLPAPQEHALPGSDEPELVTS